MSEKKKDNIIVKFSQKYMNQEYMLLQHLGFQGEMERMNYVTRYLVKNRKTNTGVGTEIEPGSDH